ncbi:helix-turn-helix domain-containing protein [Virgibacillus dakarensis]|uniref:helix-turn-helix domain-containing protein n=1 Tax=Virgibacillus dakarensis TaxID=1917889 RepID=UPI000B4428B4|nr:helix-turn-helix transcriptional regulator [Virgibacillus dakarensis]MTW88376.1 helix-turn-helix domain-containing protein [Virgibacillus dakarensis]
MSIIEAHGIILRKYRNEANLSQEQLALKCNLDRTYIGMLERGQRQPTISTLFSIAENLNIAASAFIKEVEELLDGEISNK